MFSFVFFQQRNWTLSLTSRTLRTIPTSRQHRLSVRARTLRLARGILREEQLYGMKGGRGQVERGEGCIGWQSRMSSIAAISTTRVNRYSILEHVLSDQRKYVYIRHIWPHTTETAEQAHQRVDRGLKSGSWGRAHAPSTKSSSVDAS